MKTSISLTTLAVLGGLSFQLHAHAKPGDGAFIKAEGKNTEALVARTIVQGDRFVMLDEELEIKLLITGDAGEDRMFNDVIQVAFGTVEETGRRSAKKALDDPSPWGKVVTVRVSTGEIFSPSFIEGECLARAQSAAEKSGKSLSQVFTDQWYTSFKTSVPVRVYATADDPWTFLIQSLTREGGGTINQVTVKCGQSGGAGLSEAGMGNPTPEGSGGGSGNSNPPRDTSPPRDTGPSRATSQPSDASTTSETGSARATGRRTYEPVRAKEEEPERDR